MNNFQEIANFIWSIADEVLRDDFKRGKYPDVILPFTVLRRLDCVLAPTKEKVLKRYEDLKAKGLENMDGQLRRAAGHSFYNISKFDFPKLLDDPKNIGKNLRSPRELGEIDADIQNLEGEILTFLKGAAS